MRTTLVDDILHRSESFSDYRFFFDSLDYLRFPWRTDDVHYALYRFLRNGDRRLFLNSLLGGSLINKDGIESWTRGRRVVPQNVHRRQAVRLEQYQDIVCDGKVLSPGIRECMDRYGVIKEFLTTINKPFSVFELGANLGYFSLNIVADFEAVCFCAEGSYSEWLHAVLAMNGNPSVYGLGARFSLSDLKALAEVEHFDVVLALSVVHHLDGPIEDVVETLRKLADYVILEMPTEANACGGELLAQAIQYDTSSFDKIGEGRSHLGGAPRPIYVVRGQPAALTRPYLTAPRTLHNVFISGNDARPSITKSGVTRPFIPGMNAHSFLYFGGFFPKLSDMMSLLSDLLVTSPHGDLTWWNVVLSRQGPVAIDGASPLEDHGFNDDLQFTLMKNIALLCEYKNETKATYEIVAGNAERILLDGWYRSENWGTWSSALSATLALPGKLAKHNVTLIFELHFASKLVSDASQQIIVNDTRLWSSCIGQVSDSQIKVSVPASIWNRSIPVFIELVTDKLQLAGGSDERLLGVALRSLEVRYDLLDQD